MSDNTGRLTVVIPAYNIEDLLGKCVESVIAQDYPEDLLEIIIVDDGSTDSTGAIADDYASRYGNVSAIHKVNGGSSSARNLGIASATGEYIGFVDSDDYVDSRMYSALMEAAKRLDADMVQISRDEIAENGEMLPDVITPPEAETEITPKEHLRTLLMFTGDASFCTKITRRSVFGDDLRFPEGELNEDFYLMIKALERVNKLVILPPKYYHVFYRTGSNTRKRAEEKDYFPRVFTDIVRNADVALRNVSEKYPDLVPVAMRFGFHQRLDYLLHIPVSKMTSDNGFYMDVVKNIRKNVLNIMSNKYLSKRDKIYLLILAPAPRLVRKLHALVRGL